MVATVDRPDWMAKGTSELLGAVSIQPMATASLAGVGLISSAGPKHLRRLVLAWGDQRDAPAGCKIELRELRV